MNGKVCILTNVHQPFDTRIFYKEARTLMEAGYEVTLIARHSRDEMVDGIRILPLPLPLNRFARIFSLSWQALKIALHQDCNVYHFHDPELIFIGIIFKFFGKKVIYDVHEDFPRQIQNKEWIGNEYIRSVVALIMVVSEKISAMFFDQIIAATEDIARKFPKNKTIVLRNLPILKIIDHAAAVHHKHVKPVVIYTGGLTKIRGIKETIQALEYIGNKAELWLLGNWQNEEYREECEKEAGWKYTRYLGFKPLEELYVMMKSADIGISLLYPVQNYLTSLPVKTFEYMACSLPVVMSDFPFWRETFKDSALFADPQEPRSIAKQISYLLDHKPQADAIGKKGRELVENQCNWETESKKLIGLYHKLLNE